MAISSTGYKVGKHPLAQSFYVAQPSGIYCTKIDLYLKTADTSAPIQIEIRPMSNGFPSASEVLPGSIKALPGSTFAGGANISDDATTAVSFELDEPLYLAGQRDYALVITADSKDYEVYVAQINEFVVGSTEKRINKQPTLGSLFYSQNATTFTPAQNQDLTFRIHRAKFKTTSSTVRLKNAPVPKQLLLRNPITTTSGSQTVTVLHPNHGMQVGQPVVISGVDSAGVGGIFASTLNKRYNITAMDFTGYQFTADSAADSDAIGGGSLVQSTKNIAYNKIFPNIQTIIPPGANINTTIKTTTGKSYGGVETAFQKDTEFKSLRLLQNTNLTRLNLVAHDSAETSELGSGVKSLEMEIELNQDSNNAGMIDLQRSSVALINNIIDKQASSITTGFNVPLNFVDETSAIGGSAASKHLSRAIVLEEEAVGLKILIDANRPSVADFQVYVRTCDADENIREQSFTLLSAETVVPSDDNPQVFRQYTFLHGGLGGDLTAFKKYQTKIVFRSTNQALVPVLRNLRVIALSV